jgi:hypothetical protein
MAKIRISRPQAQPGVNLYGSLRAHRSFVCIDILLDNAGDHLRLLGDDGSDEGFKGARESKLMRVEQIYDHSRPSISHEDEQGTDGRYKIGEFKGTRLVDAPELSHRDRRGTIVTVHMSFEQFAELMVSTGHLIDCTLDTVLGGFGLAGERYREQVEPPAPIKDRLERRMVKAHSAALNTIHETLKDLPLWNCTTKVKDKVIACLHSVEQSIIDNAAFSGVQATEEISRVAEAGMSLLADKIGELESDGRLPGGSTRKLLKGIEPSDLD